MKRWLVELITNTLSVIYSKLGTTLVVLGPRDSAVLITETGEVSCMLASEQTEGSNSSRGWAIMLTWAFTPEGEGALDELYQRFTERFALDAEPLDSDEK
ncbi:hypothetical protein [Magnetospirillum molischianum]|uniref:Uncharacterized protein n=1 Tax=Magnetospirillum molischianum DSM 120 TaxID=1150626 RepID=H8FY28_MAGML|nr:hypothetical protein [Magnetospirillum molischianum]CCG43266.1 hypothetical protein PHAMO_80057 [Magnetospirillum molischianum DSM 120]